MSLGEGNPFSLDEYIIEWTHFLVGIGLVLLTVLRQEGIYVMGQEQWDFLLSMLIGVLFVTQSGVIKRLRKVNSDV